MSSYVTRKTAGETEWFADARFGMFIHFGLYALPARHEWIKSLEKISEEHYEKYFEHFNPDMCDPKEWARQAKAAGMKYAVLTTKHHEGFCLFDSQYTDYKSTNTPCGRDLVREFVDAFRAEGLRIGLYYSLLDWHHPEFTIDTIHPRTNDPDAYEQSKNRDMKKYAKYMRDQVTELLTNYGKIDIMWFDFSYDKPLWDGGEGKEWMHGKGKDDWESEELIKLIRSIQPHVIINNRCGIDQDIWTPEQSQPKEWVTDSEGNLVTWEACQTFSGSWGYHRNEATWKTPEMLIRMLVNTVAAGGNMIMNVGPTSRGYLDYRAEKGLKVFGDWLKYNGRSIYGCTMAEPELHKEQIPCDCRLTQSNDGKRLYIHLIDYPFNEIKLNFLAGKIDYAQLLADGSEVNYVETLPSEKSPGELLIRDLTALNENTFAPVIEIFLK